VRGCFKLCRQPRQDAFQILNHIIVPKSHDAKSISRQPRVSFGIARGIVVLTAIDLDDQPRFETEKVCNVGTDRNLPAEFECSEPAIL